MELRQVDPRGRATMTFTWGYVKWFVQPDTTPGGTLTFGEVVLNPGMGHDRHKHDTAEEVLYVLSGTGTQMLADGGPFPIHPGDTIYVPQGTWHATHNTSWQPLRLIAVYNPGGSEEQLLTGQPDYAEVPAGQVPQFVRPADVG